MSYTFEGFLIRGPVLFNNDFDRLVLGHGLNMVPLLPKTRLWAERRFKLKERSGLLGFDKLSPAVQQLGLELSKNGQCAYVHAEFFGGRGFHAVVGWEKDAVALEPIFTCTAVGDGPGHWYKPAGSSDSAINRALRFLGVGREPGLDEFATVGLGRHRDTYAWVDRAD